MLFGVNTPGGPRNIVSDVGLDPPREGGSTFKFWDPIVSPEWPATEILCSYRGVGGPKENYAKEGLILNFGIPFISPELLKLRN